MIGSYLVIAPEVRALVHHEDMGRGWRVLAWLGGALAGVCCTAVGVLLFRAGLDDADKWASVIAVAVAVAGLPLTIYGIVLARRSLNTAPTAPMSPMPPVSPPAQAKDSQVVSGGSIQGDNIQIGRARDVDIRRDR
ncbi:hypothetical protein AB0L53_09545 [Nonomuraea sp. NPDC052129]|uniref:hypothetical protein n=1 Tax=Nonomuraea sp. NPDC052129 TaxID=3154651 RepID=UPI003433305C